MVDYSESVRRRAIEVAIQWIRGIPRSPTVEPDRFQGADEPYPGHWRFPPRPWPADPADELSRSELLRGLLGELPATWRAVVVARDVEGRSAEDVAAELGITPDEQVPLLHGARAALRKALAEHYEQRTSGSAGPQDSP